MNFVQSFEKILISSKSLIFLIFFKSSVIKISIYAGIKLHIQVVQETLEWGALAVLLPCLKILVRSCCFHV